MFKGIRHRVNLYRRYSYWSKSNCIFIHVPKAAGTSFNKAIYGRTLGHYTAEEIKKKFPSLYGKAYTFSLVRNPWDRALSAYRFACIGRTESMGINNPGQYKIPEFTSFENFVNDWLPYQNINQADFVFREQAGFVCDSNNRLMLDHLGRVESLYDTVAVLKEKIGVNVEIGYSNSTKPLHDDYRKHYTNGMVEVVGSVYARDVSLFGYSFE